MHKIIILRKAKEDLNDIFLYIASDNPFYAKDVIDNIYVSMKRLSDFPFIWTEISWEVRQIVEPRYRYKVVYSVDLTKKTIRIISVFKYKNSWN